MRTLRLSLVGTVITVLLGGVGGAVLAQAEQLMDVPLAVTGQENCTVVRGSDHIEYDGGWQYLGALSDCRDAMSDPRVSGTFRNTYNADCPDSAMCRYWGTHVLEGPSGGWDCTWAGLEDPYADSQNEALVLGICPGTGDYEGLTYMFQHVFGGRASFGDATDFKGLIYAGDPPPIGLATTPTSE